MKIELPTADEIKETKKMGKEFFGTELDSEQLDPDSVSPEYILNHEGSLVVANESETIMGYFFAFPSTKTLMHKFIEREINEQQLFDLSKKEKTFDSIYLCGAFVKPEFRRKGVATEMILFSVDKLSDKKEIQLFAWGYSKEGGLLVKNISKKLNAEIKVRKD